MSDIIRLLPDSVANQIAAGEVIQRPASVIKELVENAVDAGATEIRVFVRDAGKTLIQVVDNGKGMSETDARMAFERHATSKIQAVADLFSLRTMGFRGEALPSICAIAEVELRTRTEDEALGTRLLIEGSKVIEQQPDVCEKGASFSVRKLFWNVPARRKFLKSDTAELSYIMREFERLALVNCGIRMSIDTGSRTIDLHPATFKQRIADIWKNNLKMQLLPVEVQTQLVNISGYVSRPEGARRRNALQYLIVNGRNMRHPRFRGAILRCFEGLIPHDMQPCFFIRFDVDPGSIDVNIHPTKEEINFQNEPELISILAAAVRSTLGRNGAVPSIDFENDAMPATTVPDGTSVAPPTVGLDRSYNPFAPSAGSSGKTPGRSIGSSWRPTSVGSDWDKLYRNFVAGAPAEQPADTSALPAIDGMEAPPGVRCLQIDDRYIVVPTEQGLMIIDQHRAHIKILYERFLEDINSNESASQAVLFPDMLTLDSAQQLALESVEDELTRMGFRLSCAKEGEWKIEGVPALLAQKDCRDVILRVLESVADGSDEGASRIIETVARTMASAAAIGSNRRLSPDEMEQIVADLFSLSEPSYTPSGRPVMRLIPKSDISALFA